MPTGFRCTEMLEKLDKELSLIQGWREKAETTGSGEGEVDIREPYDAQAEAAWKEEHKKRVSNYKRALSSSTSQNEQVGLFQRAPFLVQISLYPSLQEIPSPVPFPIFSRFRLIIITYSECVRNW